MKGLQKKPIEIYLESRQNNTLELLAKRMGISKPEIIRKSLDKFLSELPVEEDPAMGLIGLGNSSKGDFSEKHDIYLARDGSSKKK